MHAEKKSKIRAEIGISDFIENPIKHKGHKGTRRKASSLITLCVLPGVRLKCRI